MAAVLCVLLTPFFLAHYVAHLSDYKMAIGFQLKCLLVLVVFMGVVRTLVIIRKTFL